MGKNLENHERIGAEKQNMIRITQKKDCCGCGACVQSCPVNCIRMCQDAEGFFYPAVDEKACMRCGKCQRVCPVLNGKTVDDEILAHGLACTKDENMRKNSSSGGVFSLLAEEIFKQNGVVFGAAFDGQLDVHHIGVWDVQGLELLRGSKYVESRIEGTFVEAKKELDTGKTVLFSGTPCQIAGLQCFLGKEYENLYTVDLICHGVPSPKVWQRYLSWKQSEQGADVRRVFFRDKGSGWKAFSMKMEFDDLTVYEQCFEKDPFMRLFLQDICLRPSCYACRFKRLNRVSDLTLGDAWGVGKYRKEMDDDKGTSVILVHSKKGERLLQAVEGQLRIDVRKKGKILPSVLCGRRPVIAHPNREKFFEKLDQEKGFDELMGCLKLRFSQRVWMLCKRIWRRRKL